MTVNFVENDYLVFIFIIIFVNNKTTIVFCLCEVLYLLHIHYISFIFATFLLLVQYTLLRRL